MVTLLTNINGLNAARAINNSNKKVSLYSKQVSTGQKNVEAGMGTADEIIAGQIKSRLSTLGVAKTNITQAQGLYQAVDDSYNAMYDAFQRMSEIAQTASSGLLADSDRVLLDLEFQSTLTNIDKTSELTAFGSTKLLNGMYGRKNVGPAVDKDIAVGAGLIAANFAGANKLSVATAFPNNDLASYVIYKKDGTTAIGTLNSVYAFVDASANADDNLDNGTTISRFQVEFHPTADADERFTISVTDSRGELHTNAASFITDKLTKATPIDINLKNSLGEQTFSFSFDTAVATMTFFDVTSPATIAASLLEGHHVAEEIERLLTTAFFGTAVTPKIQVGGDSTYIDMPIDQVNSRIALGYKVLDVTDQANSLAAITDLKTAINNIATYIANAKGTQGQLGQILEVTETNMLQQSNSLVALTSVDLSEAALNLVTETIKLQSAISTLQQSIQSFKSLGSITQNL